MDGNGVQPRLIGDDEGVRPRSLLVRALQDRNLGAGTIGCAIVKLRPDNPPISIAEYHEIALGVSRITLGRWGKDLLQEETNPSRPLGPDSVLVLAQFNEGCKQAGLRCAAQENTSMGYLPLAPDLVIKALSSRQLQLRSEPQ